MKDIVFRAIHPASVNRCVLVRRNFPELLEAAEVVQPNAATGFRGPAQAMGPPFVSSVAHHIPVIQGISPTLARLAEGIGRNAGVYLGIKLIVKPNHLRIS